MSPALQEQDVVTEILKGFLESLRQEVLFLLVRFVMKEKQMGFVNCVYHLRERLSYSALLGPALQTSSFIPFKKNASTIAFKILSERAGFAENFLKIFLQRRKMESSKFNPSTNFRS